MSLPHNVSRETRIYLAIWRKAYRERETGEPLFVQASSMSTALTMRRGMYRAIRPYRDGTFIDAELKAAAEALIVSMPQESDPKLILRPRASLTDLELALMDLGLGDEDLLLDLERSAASALNDLLPSKEPNPSAGRSTPFYTRED